MTDHSPLTAADFQIDVTGEQATVCPAGHPSIRGVRAEGCAGAGRGPLLAGTTCEPCPLRSRCPVKLDRRAGAYVIIGGPGEGEHRAAPGPIATEEWRKRYDIRAGIVGNELRAEARPRAWALAGARGPSGAACFYLKALACNFKRILHARLVEMENTAQRAVGTVPAVAAA